MGTWYTHDEIVDPRNITPCLGHWLKGLGPKFDNLFFNLKDIENYPFELPNELGSKISQLLYKAGTYNGILQYFSTAGPSSRGFLEEAVTIIRNYIIDNYKTKKNVVRSDYDRSRSSKDHLPKEELERRLFYLHIAKQVVHRSEAPSLLALRYGLDKINVKIWTTIYLTKGESAFFDRGTSYSRDDEKRIIRQHIDSGASIDETCARYLIFTHNRFKHMRRRSSG